MNLEQELENILEEGWKNNAPYDETFDLDRVVKLLKEFISENFINNKESLI